MISLFSLLAQSGLPVSLSQASILWWVLLVFIPVALVLVGMLLGFRALHEIRLADGSLGGTAAAVLAAGLAPALGIVAACGVAFMFLAESVAPVHRARSEVWLVLGSGVGIWLSFLMLRAMHRHASGWRVPAAVPAAPAGLARNALTGATVVLTVLGAALALLILIGPSKQIAFMFSSVDSAAMLDLIVLVGALICSILARREPVGKVCAWINGLFFVALLERLSA